MNGLTTDYLAAYGLPLHSVWGAFLMFVWRCELIVAHNVDFDRTILRVTVARFESLHAKDWPEACALPERPWFCTKEAAAPVCCLPGRSGYPPRAKEGKYKWPTLDEAHRLLCGGPVEHAHDAMADAEACARVYFALRERAGRQTPEANAQ